MSDIANPGDGFTYDFTDLRISEPKGIYKFTGYFRTAYEGELTELRLLLDDSAGNVFTGYIYPTSDAWLKVEFYVEMERRPASLKVMGGTTGLCIQQYCIDNFSLVKVDSIPDDYKRLYSFGKTVSEFKIKMSENGSAMTFDAWDAQADAKYDRKGIIINRDIDFIGTCSSNVTREELVNYVYSHKDSQITDFMINVFCQVASYPSNVVTDFIDEYHYNMDNDRDVTENQEMAHIMFEEKGIDYIDIWCKTFREIGIHPWLSYRMNDAHGFDSADYPANKITMPFYYNNCGINKDNNYSDFRRFQHPSTTNKYYQNLLDYSYEEVREYLLKMINESLGRYDCYGIELDFQRDVFIWHVGGEYAGLDILTEFMREVNRIVSIHEEIRGHEIKIGLRCVSDIQTNYDLGYDVIRWASEGLIDMVNPTSRWATTDLDVPVALWASIMHPYGVEVIPGFEALIQVSPGSTRANLQSLNTMAAASANWFTQGADKIYLYNMFLGLTHIFDIDDRISTIENAGSTGSGIGHFNMLTTIGSYEKVMNCNREMLITYNDMYAYWKECNNQLPLSVAKNASGALRIPVGDIPVGAKVMVNITASGLNETVPPQIYVNGTRATYVSSRYLANGLTSSKILTYSVLESVYAVSTLSWKSRLLPQILPLTTQLYILKKLQTKLLPL